MSEEPKPVKPPRTLAAFAEMLRISLEPLGLKVIQRPSTSEPTDPPVHKFFFKRPIYKNEVLKDEDAEDEDTEDEEEDEGWKEIASGDDNISVDLLDWSGLQPIWEKYRLREFECFQALAARAHHISIDREGWGGDSPGLSGSWQTAKTDDEIALKNEFRVLVARLIWQNKAQIHICMHQ